MRISTEIEIPETLHNRAVEFVEAHRDWNYDKTIAAALVLFLADQDKKAARRRQPC